MIPDYNSAINWTTGKIRTEIHFPIGKGSPNLGQYYNNNYSAIKDELHRDLIKAMGYVRISDVFLLKDYYSMKSDIRFEIIAYADRAFYYPVMQRGSEFIGVVELNLFGEDGVASIFDRDIAHLDNTNYINPASEQEYFDGLIIDTGSFEFNPSLQMRIFDEDGVLLYGPETVDKLILQKSGVCEYTTSLTEAFYSSRIGSKVFYTEPFGITGSMKNNFVLNNSDAARLFGNPQTLKSLNQSHVVIVSQPRK
jgi:hypothetical protein